MVFMSLELGMTGREIKSFTMPWTLTFSLSISVYLGFFAFALGQEWRKGSFSRFFQSAEIHLALLTAMIHPSAIPYSLHSLNRHSSISLRFIPLLFDRLKTHQQHRLSLNQL
jgi:hypothetical protein